MKLRIALPNKGRLKEPSIELLKSAGLKIRSGDDKALFVKTNNPDIDIIFVRVEDIPQFVDEGVADLGIVGRDVVKEKSIGNPVLRGVKDNEAWRRKTLSVNELMPLNFGYCSLVLAAKEDSGINSVKDLGNDITVATKFLGLTVEYLRKNGKSNEVIDLSGAVEIAPVIGLADVIVDLTSTGSTLKAHGLKIVETILESQAVLIAKEGCSGELLDDLLLALKGVVDAEKKKYLMVNLPDGKLAELEKASKGMLSPTVTKLDKEGWISAQMVIEEKEVFGLIKKLKEIGGRDILVLPIERLVK